ncbi:hypothetical protein ACFQXA_09395 [Nocardiopsis composta]
MADALVADLKPAMARLAGLFPLDRQAAVLLDQLNERALRPVQHRVLRRVQQRLTRPGGD